MYKDASNVGIGAAL
ncbi:hypothetical protein AYI69_g7366, partial [Smittium culicis]